MLLSYLVPGLLNLSSFQQILVEVDWGIDSGSMDPPYGCRQSTFKENRNIYFGVLLACLYLNFVFYDVQSNMCTTVTLGKWQGDCYIQGDPYKQVNFAENIGQLKI